MFLLLFYFFFFFFNDTATTEIYTLSLHDALPISRRLIARRQPLSTRGTTDWPFSGRAALFALGPLSGPPPAWTSGQSAKPERQGEGHERKDLDRRDAAGDSRTPCARARDWRHHRYRAEARGRRARQRLGDQPGRRLLAGRRRHREQLP